MHIFIVSNNFLEAIEDDNALSHSGDGCHPHMIPVIPGPLFVAIIFV